jgi:FtsP/CotA-like multicopper oxidase with cupredoxin domain
MIIGGMILVMVLGFNANIIQGAALQTFKTNVQSNMTTVTNIMEYDFRKMGFQVPFPQDSSFTYADSTRMIFKGDFNNDGSVETIEYSFVAGTHAPGVVNPRAKVLYRRYNGGPAQAMNVGITRFRFDYYNAAGTPIGGNVVGLPSSIKSFRVTINMESKEPYDTEYAGVCWDRTIKPRNLR